MLIFGPNLSNSLILLSVCALKLFWQHVINTSYLDNTTNRRHCKIHQNIFILVRGGPTLGLWGPGPQAQNFFQNFFFSQQKKKKKKIKIKILSPKFLTF
jgi:hypothetical protein